MTTDSIKRTLYDQFAQVARAVAHGYRLELLEFLAQGERNVDELVQLTGLPVATVSQHLQHLRRAGLVQTRRDGRFVCYSITSDEVLALVSALREVAEHNLATVRQLAADFHGAPEALEPVSLDELSERLHEDSVTLLDVRPPAEYAAGHLPGALNIPVGELAARLDELTSAEHVIAYCRGPYCALSLEAVRMLQAHGVSARRLQEGYPEWRLAVAGAPLADHESTH